MNCYKYKKNIIHPRGMVLLLYCHEPHRQAICEGMGVGLHFEKGSSDSRNL